jgi:hypothetical protein
VLIAMANKSARLVWAMLSHGETHRPDRPGRRFGRRLAGPGKDFEGDDLMAKHG